MSCFLPDDSPKFWIVLRSSNRRSRDRRNQLVPESKANPASPQLHFKNEAFFCISYQNVFLAHFRISGFVVSWFGLSKFQNLTDHLSIVRCQSVHMPFEAAAQNDFCLPASVPRDHRAGWCPEGKKPRACGRLPSRWACCFSWSWRFRWSKSGPLNVSWANYSDLKAMMFNLSLSLPISAIFFKANTNAKKSKILPLK